MLLDTQLTETLPEEAEVTGRERNEYGIRERQTDRQTGRQRQIHVDSQTGGQTDRQTDKQIDRQTDISIYMHMYGEPPHR